MHKRNAFMQASACLLKQRPVSVIALRCGARPLRQRRSCAAPVMALLSSDKQQRQEKVQQMYREYKAESFSEACPQYAFVNCKTL